MSIEAFAREVPIVRRIWGDADLVLLVFAGAAAEFALNRAVDWLFFTSRRPRDPLGRLFSTAVYAQRIALTDLYPAERTLSGIRAAHAAVERRGAQTPRLGRTGTFFTCSSTTRSGSFKHSTVR